MSPGEKCQKYSGVIPFQFISMNFLHIKGFLTAQSLQTSFKVYKVCSTCWRHNNLLFHSSAFEHYVINKCYFTWNAYWYLCNVEGGEKSLKEQFRKRNTILKITPECVTISFIYCNIYYNMHIYVYISKYIHIYLN